MRRLIGFACEGDPLVATLDEASGTTALLIVSGGNEVRAGAHRGMALLAARFAATGTPVLRFDRRGVGDAGGINRGYASSGPDIAAAAALLRREQPHVARLVGFGNCDGGSALALFGRAAGIDAVVLANLWAVETGDLPPAAAIRQHYARRLTDRRSWARLIAGRIDLQKLLRGLRHIAAPQSQGLAHRIVAAVADWGDRAEIVLARGDATAIAFADAARARALAAPIRYVESASHSFAEADDGAALDAVIRSALHRFAGGTERPALR